MNNYEYEYRQMMTCLMNITDTSDFNNDLEKALRRYNGRNHEFLHRNLLANMQNLPYSAILLLGTTLETPWTPDTLEIQIMALSLIMKETHWDGTAQMLTKTEKEGSSPLTDPDLDGFIIEYFALSQRTPQEIIINARHYLKEDDTMLLRGYLAVIYGWLCRGPFDENAKDFLNELKILMNNTPDASIKQQINEILEVNPTG